MKNSPNKSPETSNESILKTYRTRIILILSVIALGMLCGRGCEDEAETKDSDENNKPKLADSSGNGEGDGDDEGKIKRSTIFVERGDPEFCEQLTDEEYKIRADEIRQDKAEDMVDHIIEALCIENPSDQDAIYRALSNGYTSIADFWSSYDNDEHSITLMKPIASNWKYYEGTNTIKLSELPTCEWPNPISETDDIFDEITGDMKAGDYTKALRKVVDDDKIREDGRLLGIDEEEIEDFLEIIADFGAAIDESETRKEMQTNMCRLIVRLGEFGSDKPNQSFYSRYSPALFGNFLEIMVYFIFNVEFPDCDPLLFNNSSE